MSNGKAVKGVVKKRRLIKPTVMRFLVNDFRNPQRLKELWLGSKNGYILAEVGVLIEFIKDEEVDKYLEKVSDGEYLQLVLDGKIEDKRNVAEKAKLKENEAAEKKAKPLNKKTMKEIAKFEEALRELPERFKHDLLKYDFTNMTTQEIIDREVKKSLECMAMLRDQSENEDIKLRASFKFVDKYLPDKQDMSSAVQVVFNVQSENVDDELPEMITNSLGDN